MNSSRLMRHKLILPIVFAFQLFSILWVSDGFSQAEPFYKGKQIRIITGATAGGFYAAGADS